ncbi:hypothetical protein EJB05_32870, partial [Eragrostis curvula]
MERNEHKRREMFLRSRQGFAKPTKPILNLRSHTKAVLKDQLSRTQDTGKTDRFMPERFEGENALDFKGLDFEFTPFGAGRRICPGITFAQANVEIALATLLYHFDWELPAGAKPEEIDMTEQFGLSITRKSELLLQPIARITPVHDASI